MSELSPKHNPNIRIISNFYERKYCMETNFPLIWYLLKWKRFCMVWVEMYLLYQMQW